MAIYHGDFADVELTTGTVFRTFMNHQIGEGDNSANRFGARVFRDGEPEDVSSCTVVGYFIRADGVTITITGVASGNTVYVTLPQNCYVVEGNFTLAIKVIGGAVNSTVRIIDGTVVNTSSDSVVDPGGTVPDITALNAVIADAEAAAETIAGFSIYAELIEDDDYAIVIETAEEEEEEP